MRKKIKEFINEYPRTSMLIAIISIIVVIRLIIG